MTITVNTTVRDLYRKDPSLPFAPLTKSMTTKYITSPTRKSEPSTTRFSVIEKWKIVLIALAGAAITGKIYTE